ncbi:hypothetical protein DZF91_26095 [Actinomadura logoneensis]|uniref:Uncharacterized protein n=1 Tax=Actinomadura logoneensis TaxID=2293572 RepID=A0A372JFJ9_9ACTN|nr:hypothetical protein [Actinomadura logoneensis]RFU38740.1 hypothetical protein DZF91_26095 [Actinomadura logoneensis]
MLKATILTAGAAAAMFGGLLSAPAQAAPLSSHGAPSRGCENKEAEGLLGLSLLSPQFNDCDEYVNYYGGDDYYFYPRHRHHGHHGHWGGDGYWGGDWD